MTFERTRDWQLIKSIVTHTRIYGSVTDDFSLPREKWEPLRDEGVFYLLVKELEEVLGVFILMPHNAICWDVHTCLLPKSWGERSRIATHEAIQWVFENTPCQRLITEVPEYNTLAQRLAEDSGMRPYGMNPSAYMKNGKLHGLNLLGISKGEV